MVASTATSGHARPANDGSCRLRQKCPHSKTIQAGDYAVALAIVAASLYGATDEVHQAFVPFRTAAWSDWVADTAGAAIGAVIAARFMDRAVKDGIS